MKQYLAYSRGAQGFVVAQFQAAIARALAVAVVADGILGPATERVIIQLQQQNPQVVPGSRSSPQPHLVSGHAGPDEFAAVGLTWPDEFTRAISLVSVLEGTGFGDMNATDIDGAGVTCGIAGFTTAGGEVQELLARFFAADPAAADLLALEERKSLLGLLQAGSPRATWDGFFYDSTGKAKRHIREALAAWGMRPAMRSCQLEMARLRFWNNAVTAADRLGLQSSRARLFFLDVAVQNGGWRAAHQVVANRLVKFHSAVESERLEAAARAVAACAKEKWRDDVLERKLVLAQGSGTIHGISINLTAQAIEASIAGTDVAISKETRALEQPG